MQNERPRKLQRISQACDLCHRRSIRCRPSSEDGERCQNCCDFDVACTYNRPSKRRKHPQAPAAPAQPGDRNTSTAPSSSVPNADQSTSERTASTFTSTSASSGPRTVPSSLFAPSDAVDSHKDASPTAREDLANGAKTGNKDTHNPLAALLAGETEELDVSWKAFALSAEAAVLELLDIFVLIVYPLYPLMDKLTVKKRLERRDHLTDRGFFAAVMATCALTAIRVRDGAYYGPISDNLQRPENSSEVFFTAAKQSMTSDFGKIRGTENVDYIRAYTLLSVASIQYGQIPDVQQYLGKAFTIAAMCQFYDEQSWPAELDEMTKEEYRRVYWCAYMLDVYSAVVWNCFLRSQEIHAFVRYPSHVHDDNLVVKHSPSTRQPVSWIVGWNFTLDLYRVLEHVLNKARARKFTHDDRRSVDSLVFSDTFSDRDVMQTMLNMYFDLPTQFKETPPMTGDLRKDIFSFQASNIQATLQLLRMILFSLEDGPGVVRKCDVANEVLQVFQTIPVPYLRAISTPLVYQLGSIGRILGSVLEEPLSAVVYSRVRSSLLLMADLLENLESVLHRSTGAAQSLLKQVGQLDQYMHTKRPQQAVEAHQQHQSQYQNQHQNQHKDFNQHRHQNQNQHQNQPQYPNQYQPLPILPIMPSLPSLLQQPAPANVNNSSENGQLNPATAIDRFQFPDFQIVSGMRLDWPWQHIQDSNVYPINLGVGIEGDVGDTLDTSPGASQPY